MGEISISWDPDPIGTIYIPDGTQTMTFGLGRGAICSTVSLLRHQPQPFRASDLSPFLVVSAVKISITSSLSFYSLASFPASPSLLIILSLRFSSKTHSYANKLAPSSDSSVLPALMSLSAER